MVPSSGRKDTDKIFEAVSIDAAPLHACETILDQEGQTDFLIVTIYFNSRRRIAETPLPALRIY